MAARSDVNINHFVRERQQVTQKLAQERKKLGAPPPPDTGSNKNLYERLEVLLAWLEHDVDMTPDFKQQAQVDKGLALMFKTPGYHFPAKTAERAEALFQKFEQMKWGADDGDADVKTEDLSDDEMRANAAKRIKRSPVRRDSKDNMPSRTIKYPPEDHPIWGVNGIMHGTAIRKSESGNWPVIFNPNFQKRNGKVFGHNGIKVGTWYPRQLVAVFNGAHGDIEAGISGDAGNGAFSIVVSGKYDDLDKDEGEVLRYSADGSHKNTDPKEIARTSNKTVALQRSLETQKPVRVLRSHSGKSRYYPSVGIRYDGLYRVVKVQYPFNQYGGKFEQFVLEREDGQGNIRVLRFRPNAQEIRDEARIANKF